MGVTGLCLMSSTSLSACLPRAGGRARRKRSGRGRSALSFNVLIITSNSICAAPVCTWRTEDSFGGGVNPLLPLVCGSQGPNSTNSLLGTGSLIYLCAEREDRAFPLVGTSVPASGLCLPPSLTIGPVQFLRPMAKGENGLHVCLLTCIHVPSCVHALTHTSPSLQTNKQTNK